MTFEIAQGELPETLEVENVYLVGEFNGWNPTATPMKYSPKNKAFRATLALEPGQDYQFRYLVNGQHWCNDWAADRYVANGLGQDNCVVTTPEASDAS
ncbi:MAG: isoamylase early set domain-containing protein [Chloroflexi bacterium]|nr:isoamylase early set domain-containing protein [Chloroflexota bacterium]MCI0575763.1 isoamylase early set domain-containing protein [Chloroflexota bacterium]MCI0643630.1 isoamylase early set domain-containing protein [Chloroflexota bacterium]